MSHNPNPFDFTPFSTTPLDLRTTGKWLELDDLKTGYLELQIQALTPVHIVGIQEATETSNQKPQGRGENKQNFKILNSQFYRRHDHALIPSSSIRGLLRSFIEAACNCWASQMTPFYLKERNKRNIGFRVFESPDELDVKNKSLIDFSLAPSLPKQYEPFPTPNGEVDLASFLFGYVPKEEGKKGWRSRVSIEDAPVSANNLSNNNSLCRVPDVEDSAFMGGPNPSASSWWYQKPYGIRRKQSGRFPVCDFIGVGYRGRKFYYHQDPRRCIDWYLDPKNWKSRTDHPVYHFPIECLDAGKTTESFLLYFEDIPSVLLKLLLLAIQPGNRLRHKLGYGKAYGYGSINFHIKSGVLRGRGTAGTTSFPVREIFDEIHHALWDEGKLENIGVGQFLHIESLTKLTQILWYQEPLNQLFTYPPFDNGGFLPSVRDKDLTEALPHSLSGKLSNVILKVSESQARTIAEKLSMQGRRPALHFEVYQERSEGYAQIQSRKLEQAI